ncbi:MAG: hypothetical protein F4W92_07060 [Gammaproteobacteria bacterium]|nr:hypothetical protein [Gammaproteobacteria bacterium]
MLNRRKFTIATTTIPFSLVLTRSLVGQTEEELAEVDVAESEEETSETEIPEELKTAKLIYLTPIKTDGEESKCQGEVWYVYLDSKIYVTTATDAWRAEAIRKDLPDARIWIGDYGVWTSAKEKYKEGPELMIEGAIFDDEDKLPEILKAFTDKYGTGRYPRVFKEEIEEEKRVVLEYEVK